MVIPTFGDHCKKCNCKIENVFNEKTCPCGCHEAFSMLLEALGGNIQAAKMVLKIQKELIRIDPETRLKYIKTRLQNEDIWKFQETNK